MVQTVPLPKAQAAELDRRVLAHSADPGSAIPWTEVQRRVQCRWQGEPGT
jgi:putative addiction module component (TIGR02574 family)